MATNTITLTKKVKKLEQRVMTLERTLPIQHKTQRENTTAPYSLGSYQVLSRLKGLLKNTRGEDPLLYQRRIRKESERASV